MALVAMTPERWRELEPLLDRALELPADERETWLRELRERTPDLAAQLTRLLTGEADADSDAFLTAPLDASLVGVQLGAWTIERALGQGGMGSVWLARRSDGRFEGHAAIKLLNFGLLGAHGRERFHREGTVLARLTHPGIARLLDAGVSPGGQPYLVLEHVDGERIDDYVQGAGLDVDARVRLFLDVLAAVGHAHANLIVHRDLKPSNILVTPDGSVKLLDFGIAALLDLRAREESAVPAEGSRAFTPGYAAPEQVRGGAITTATDVYGLGVLLYALVTGHHPTAGDGHTRESVIEALLESAPAPPGLGDLDFILAKALRKEPRERYQSAGAFADDLRRFLAHEPVSARASSVWYRAIRFVQRNRSGVAIATVVATGLVAATWFSAAQMERARHERDAALFETRRADAQAEFQSMLMSQVGDRPASMREIVDRGRAVLERQYAGDPRMLAMLLTQLSDRYEELDDPAARGAVLQRAESLAVLARDAAQLLIIHCDRASVLRSQGRYDSATALFDRLGPALGATTNPEATVVCLAARAELDNETNRSDRTVPLVERAIAIRDSMGRTNDLVYAGLLGNLASALDHEHQSRAALRAYWRTLAALDGSGRGEMMIRSITEHDLALTLASLGETAAADSLLHDVLLRVMRSDPTGRIPQQALIHYAHVALFQGEADSAAKYFALLVRQGVTDHSSYWEGRGLFGLAQAQMRQGLDSESRRTVERFRRLSATAELRRSDDQVTDVRYLDALRALAGGDTTAALSRVTDLLRANGYFAGKRRAIFRSALMLAARCALARGDPAAALRFAGDARTTATLDSLADSRSAYVGVARLVEARALLVEGDTVAARSALRRARDGLRAGAGMNYPGVRAADALLSALGA